MLYLFVVNITFQCPLITNSEYYNTLAQPLQQSANASELKIWWQSANNLEPGSTNTSGFQSLQGTTRRVINGSFTSPTHGTRCTVAGCSRSTSCEEGHRKGRTVLRCLHNSAILKNKAILNLCKQLHVL